MTHPVISPASKKFSEINANHPKYWKFDWLPVLARGLELNGENFFSGRSHVRRASRSDGSLCIVTFEVVIQRKNSLFSLYFSFSFLSLFSFFPFSLSPFPPCTDMWSPSKNRWNWTFLGIWIGTGSCRSLWKMWRSMLWSKKCLMNNSKWKCYENINTNCLYLWSFFSNSKNSQKKNQNWNFTVTKSEKKYKIAGKRPLNFSTPAPPGSVHHYYIIIHHWGPPTRDLIASLTPKIYSCESGEHSRAFGECFSLFWYVFGGVE